MFWINEKWFYICTRNSKGALAQLVEQWTENPCVPGSIPGGTTVKKPTQTSGFFVFIMIHFLYILHSKSKDKYYIGETPNVDFRLELHNSHSFKNSFTKIAEDWTIALQFECKDKKDALYLEAFIKRMKSKKFIQKIIDNPAILSDIILKK